MALVDDYLAKIELALSEQTSGSELHELVQDIYSVFSGVIPEIAKGLDLKKARAFVPGSNSIVYDSLGDLRKLRGKLLAYKEACAREAILNPIAAALSKIDDDIASCEKALSSGSSSDKKQVIDTIISVYSTDIKSIAWNVPGYSYTEGTNDQALSLLIEKLKQHKVRISLQQSSSAPTVSIMNNATASNSTNIEISLVQVSESIQALPDEVLSEECKDELRLMLLDMEGLRGKPKSEAKEKLKKVLLWIADKGVDVAIAAGPYLVSLIQTLD